MTATGEPGGWEGEVPGSGGTSCRGEVDSGGTGATAGWMGKTRGVRGRGGGGAPERCAGSAGGAAGKAPERAAGWPVGVVLRGLAGAGVAARASMASVIKGSSTGCEVGAGAGSECARGAEASRSASLRGNSPSGDDRGGREVGGGEVVSAERRCSRSGMDEEEHVVEESAAPEETDGGDGVAGEAVLPIAVRDAAVPTITTAGIGDPEGREEAGRRWDGEGDDVKTAG